MVTTCTKGLASAAAWLRREQLRTAVIEMAVRYGSARARAAYAGGANGDRPRFEVEKRACARRFWALQRLTEALRNAE